MKPLIPRRVQLFLRRLRFRRIMPSYKHVWPIYQEAGKTPAGWQGWPEQKKFALLLTHDVESSKGQEKCRQLAKIEEYLGFRSAFYFVPNRYKVSSELRHHLVTKGFEVGVHGLEHDGKLYQSKTEFQKRAAEINRYLKEWDSHGFSAPCMHHNLEWNFSLNIRYGISTYDTDPFEPQGGGVGTIFPFYVRSSSANSYYIELQYTLPQDFTIFVMMKEKGIDIWKNKLDWIVENGGMVHLKTHPDYMNFNDTKLENEEYPVDFYTKFLEYIKYAYDGQYWHVLPKDMTQFNSPNSQNRENGTMLKQSDILCPSCRDHVQQDRIYFSSYTDFLQPQEVSEQSVNADPCFQAR